jgi:hypothetical protein
MSNRPNTRSRGISSSSGIHDVNRYIDNITGSSSSSSQISTRRAGSDRRELVETLKTFIDKRIKLLSNERPVVGTLKLGVSDEYILICEKVLMQYLITFIRRLSVVSLHRTEQLSAASLGNDGNMMDDDVSARVKKSTAIEEWLLFKEDCATFFTRALKTAKDSAVATENGTATPPLGVPPEFNQPEYAAHASEEDKRLLITAQSVRRISLHDLLAVVSCVKMPAVLERNLVNFVAYYEVSTEYRARGYASSSPTISFSANPS